MHCHVALIPAPLSPERKLIAYWSTAVKSPRACRFQYSTASILLKTCFRQKSRRHVADLLDLSRHVEIDLSGLKQVRDFFWSLTCLRHVWNLLKTCRKPGRKPGFKQVLSNIDLMEFGHKCHVNVCSTSEQQRLCGECDGSFQRLLTIFGHLLPIGVLNSVC